jgi:hypothetical protein
MGWFLGDGLSNRLRVVASAYPTAATAAFWPTGPTQSRDRARGWGLHTPRERTAPSAGVPGRRASVPHRPNYLPRLHHSPFANVNAAEVNHNAEHPLAVVDANRVAVQLKSVR